MVKKKKQKNEKRFKRSRNQMTYNSCFKLTLRNRLDLLAKIS